MRLLFVHGAGGADTDLGLARGLAEALGADLDHPRIDDDDMSYEAWARPVREGLAGLEPGDAVVAHSFGASILVKVLAEAMSPVRQATLLAMPFWGREGWDVAEYHHTGRSDGLRLVLHHCRDDSEVPFAHLGLHGGLLTHADLVSHDKGGHQFDGLVVTLADAVRDLVSERR